MSSMVVNNILRRKGRTLITIIAVAVSCALLVSMLSVSEGILANARDAIAKSKDDIRISGSITGLHDMMEKFDEDERVQLTNPSLYHSLTFSVPPSGSILPALCDGVIPERSNVFMTKEQKSKVDGSFTHQGDPFYQNGTYENGVDSPLFTGEIMISKHIATDFNLSLGDEISLTHENRSVDFSIVGVFELEVNEDSPFRLYFVNMHLSELQYLASEPEDTNEEIDAGDGLSLYLKEEVRTGSSKIDAFVSELEEEYPYFTVTTKKDQNEAIEDSVTLSKAYYGALGSVAVSIGMLFVICIVIMNIAERTKEIGILRALGISRRSIFQMFFLESFLMVFMGSVLGVLMGVMGSHYLGEYIAGSFGIERDITLVTPWLIIFSMGITTALGSLASVYPGYRASRMKIVEAMKNVG